MTKMDLAQNHPQNYLEIHPILQNQELLIPPKIISLSLSQPLTLAKSNSNQTTKKVNS